MKIIIIKTWWFFEKPKNKVTLVETFHLNMTKKI
jgi:hypothetical protein